jgi:D-amino-acid dehydrogenase
VNVVVLGAGVIGVAPRGFCARRATKCGCSTGTRPAGMETSFANGGQISVVTPSPGRIPGRFARSSSGSAAKTHRCSFACAQTRSNGSGACAFLAECLPGRNRANAVQLLRLGLYSRATLRALRTSTGIRIRPPRARHPAFLYERSRARGERPDGRRSCASSARTGK